jgi:hypothetical protein
MNISSSSNDHVHVRRQITSKGLHLLQHLVLNEKALKLRLFCSSLKALQNANAIDI